MLVTTRPGIRTHLLLGHGGARANKGLELLHLGKEHVRELLDVGARLLEAIRKLLHV